MGLEGAIMSFFVAGLGQIYYKKYLKGVIFFFSTITVAFIGEFFFVFLSLL